jgi:hypothetical protein
VITAHSLGTLVTLRYLNSIDSVVKNKKIKNFIAMGGPLVGSSIAIQVILGGSKDLFVGDDIGFHMNG